MALRTDGNQWIERNQPMAPAVRSAMMNCTRSKRPSFASANAATPRKVSGCHAAGTSGAGDSPVPSPAGDSPAESGISPVLDEGRDSSLAAGTAAPLPAGTAAPLSLLRDGAGELGLGSALGIAAGHCGVACVG